MLDIIIQNSTIDIYQRILDTGTALIGYITGFITIYVAWLKYFSKNIKLLELGENLSYFYGDSIYCILENGTLATFSIQKIYIVDEKNKKEALLANYKPPLLLKPFETLKIEENYTTTNGVDYVEATGITAFANNTNYYTKVEFVGVSEANYNSDTVITDNKVQVTEGGATKTLYNITTKTKFPFFRGKYFFLFLKITIII